ncbi:hypothetical protein M0G74_05715 [Microbulbifer sp. CAU 1566]|uniref:hypothetical protein n=1 Tax=Microbulbifer sp. CAU 1566 TaxID=2933269 RepID=UPI0020056F1B|nr:hypothetical protein [Microbulbifer sp. CAU 1566]MCK7596768.1 hypothetical protein [Microbulbifer sp. CAU 1566]
MSIGQKIFNAIELFSAEAPHFQRFIAALKDTLIENGAAPKMAERTAEVTADALSQESAGDHHLGMAQLIAFHPELLETMGSDLPTISAMHKYMSFYLSFADDAAAVSIN